MGAMPYHRFKVGQAVAPVGRTGVQQHIPHGPLVVVRLLPLVDGQPHPFVSFVAGHSEGRQGQTLGRYCAGPTEDQLRAMVEAVKLPRDGA